MSWVFACAPYATEWPKGQSNPYSPLCFAHILKASQLKQFSELILERKRENGICQVLAFMATDELSSLCASLI